MDKSIIKVVSIILVVALVLSLGVLFAFYAPNLYADKVEIPQKVINKPTLRPVNEPIYDDLAKEKEADIYVSADAEVGKGDGSISNPFATIEEAKKKANEIKNNIDRDIVVSVRGGVYELSDEITFVPADSGVNGHKIIYRNYPEEYPIIDGGTKITNWQAYKDGIYTADIPESVSFNVLYEDGITATKARYPNDNYLTVSDNKAVYSDETVNNSFVYGKDKVIDGLSDYSNLEVFMFPGGESGVYNWFSHIYPVTELDKNTRVISVDRSAYTDNVYYMGAGSRYFLQNDLSFVDQKGEFFVDSINHKVYYMPYNEENISKESIYYASNESIFKVEASNIEFNGLTLRGTDLKNYADYSGALVWVQNADNVCVKNCKLYLGGKFGVLATGKVNGIEVTGCEMYDIGHSGVQIVGENGVSKSTSYNHKISNNYIHDMGLYIKHGTGIQLVCTKDSVISNNSVTRTPRYSISLKGELTKEANLELLDNPDYAKEMLSGNNIIEFNDCSHANEDTQDTGVIELWSAGDSNIIRNNVVHDSYIYFSFGSGIYVDDYNVNTLIENNLLYNLGAMSKRSQCKGMPSIGQLEAVIFAKYYGNTIRNNIIANCDANEAILLAEYNGTWGMERTWNNAVTNNIVYNCNNPQSTNEGFFRTYKNNFLDLRIQSADKNDVKSNISYYLSESDNNIYFNDNTPKFKIGKEYQTSITGFGKISFEKWKSESGYDANSLIVDPMFTDSESNDFSFKENSPAYELGISEIDTNSIGVQNNWYY